MSCNYVLDTYHIVVLEASTSLEKPCHSKCIVLHRPMWHSMSIVLKPENPVANRHSPILGGGESRSRGRERTEMANLLKEFNDEVHIHIPAIPVFSPKHRFVRRVWLPPITVITIASIDLHNPWTAWSIWLISSLFLISTGLEVHPDSAFTAQNSFHQHGSFEMPKEMEHLTMLEGASFCWHMTQGTPALSPSAMFAAHCT